MNSHYFRVFLGSMKWFSCEVRGCNCGVFEVFGLLTMVLVVVGAVFYVLLSVHISIFVILPE